MKTILNILVVFLLLCNVLSADNVLKGRHTKEKIIKKEYVVQPDALLKIDNSYGNINVMTYSGSTVSIEVKIKITGNDLNKVEDKLNSIKIEFQAASNLVSAKTIFKKTTSNSWWNWGKNSNVSMEIHYLVKLPIGNHVDLSNNYGHINLDRLEGNAKISCDYGKITTKELMGTNNSISFDYTNNSYFEFINNGKINADYSGFTVAKTKNLEINADYTNSIIEIAENVNYNCDYGSIVIKKSNTINGNGDYLTARFGEVYKNIEINADYGSIKIDEMTSNAGNILIKSDYTGITIGYDPTYSFKFDINLSYASLRGIEDFQLSKTKESSSDKYYSGHYNSSSTNNTIKIISDYGNITFKKN